MFAVMPLILIQRSSFLPSGHRRKRPEGRINQHDNGLER